MTVQPCFRKVREIIIVNTIPSKIRTFFGEKTGGELFFIFSLFVTVIMGIVFRSQGYFNGSISLWLDEAEWVFKLSDRPLLKNALMRPIGFLVATRFLISIVNNEITLRLMAYSASILSMPLIYLIAKEVFKSKLTVFLAVFIVSFNPVLINFAKEFKPYSLELFLHLLLLCLLLQFIKLKTAPLFYQLLFISAVTLLFAYNIVFLYPSLFLIVVCETYKEQKFPRLFFLLMAAFLLLGILLYAFYYFLWSSWDIASTKIYWGKKYDVFFLSSNFSDHVQWIVKKYLSLVESSGTATIFWDLKFNGYSIIKVALWVVHCIGLAAFVVRRKWEYLLLFVVPIVIVLLSNIMGLWPFGAFRVNVFMFCYFIIISLYGMDTLITIDNRHSRHAMISIIVALFIILSLPLGINHYKVKASKFSTPHSNMRSVLDTIFRYELSKDFKMKRNDACVLFADYHSFFAVKYYLWKHSSLSKRYERFQSNDALRLFNIGLTCDQIFESLHKITTDPQLKGMRAWILISKISCLEGVNHYFREKGNIIMMYDFTGANLLVYYQF
jgi:hypothetical protein